MSLKKYFFDLKISPVKSGIIFSSSGFYKINFFVWFTYEDLKMFKTIGIRYYFYLTEFKLPLFHLCNGRWYIKMTYEGLDDFTLFWRLNLNTDFIDLNFT